MTPNTGLLNCSLQKGTRYAATITLFSTSLLFVTYMVSLYRQHGFLESINRSLGFDVAPASPVVEFMAMLGFGLILLFEMMSSWLAIKATTLESRWLLLPFIGLTTCGIVSPALMSALIMLSSQRFHSIPLPITTLIPIFFVILTRTYFLLLSVSYYRELQERESRQEETLPSVASQVPQVHIDELPLHKRMTPILLDYLPKPPPYEGYDDESRVHECAKSGLGVRLYM
nr:uncharacterized protein LOC119174639 [Rhipicephalus microplus]